MIDTHCHILPELDDGADSEETAVMMAAIAADDGVGEIVATPHIRWDRYYTEESMERVRHAVRELSERLLSAGIPVKLYPGAEVLLAESVGSRLQRGVFPCLGETKHALVEFYFDESAERMTQMLAALTEAGIHPIVAHPERYSAVLGKKRILLDWVDRGYGLQVNQGSFLGQFGRRAKKIAHWMMENHLVLTLGSDAHDTGARVPRLTRVAAELATIYGDGYIRRITEDNPRALLTGADLGSGDANR